MIDIDSAQVDRNLDRNLDRSLKDALDRHLNLKDGRTPPHLEESIRYSLLAPGKRIRPRLALACAKMLGLDPQVVLPAALALEMMHCFTLIHDDLPCMDDDDFRRGMPSNHKKFGESLALLAGDALMAIALDVFLDSPVEPSRLMQGLKRMVWAMGPRGVIGGQAAESLLTEKSTLADLRWMHAQKTGALFSAAVLIPKDFSGISDDSGSGQAILEFASTLGLSFQAADDLEDRLEETITPTSILWYLSEKEVCQMTIENLCTASQKLTQIWGSKALVLKTIADEVILKIEATQNEKATLS